MQEIFWKTAVLNRLTEINTHAPKILDYPSMCALPLHTHTHTHTHTLLDCHIVKSEFELQS